MPGSPIAVDSPAMREGTYSSSEALISLAMSTLMVSRLARARPSSMSFQTRSHINPRPVVQSGLVSESPCGQE